MKHNPTFFLQFTCTVNVFPLYLLVLVQALAKQGIFQYIAGAGDSGIFGINYDTDTLFMSEVIYNETFIK